MSTATTPPAPQPQKTIKLHKAQADFLASNAHFRGFVGGIGSGKSWCGSYDLIRRAKAGRLYMVAAPTFTMLSDSSFRTFVDLAEGLGALDPADVRRSAPPSVKLLTGAEILFRSADDPDRLRGPNLSGCWLDESSIMPVEVFNVMVGRLREKGEQGWLTATFTPRGKANWTYSTFATGRPDTALFHCRTSDNPFLPANFTEAVRGQYPSSLAAQELDAQFLDAAGTLFKPEWFGTVEPAQLPPFVALCRSWDLAATPKDEKGSRDPDYTCGVLVGKDARANYFILDVRRLRGSPQQVQQLVLSTAHSDGRQVEIVMEQEPGSAGKAICDHYLRLLSGFPFFSVRPTGSKADRALPMAAQAEGGAVKLLRGAWNRDFLDEASLFPFGKHDDSVDAAALAFARLGWRTQTHSSGPVVLVPGFGGHTSGPVMPTGQRLGAQGYGAEGGPPGPLTPGFGRNGLW